MLVCPAGGEHQGHPADAVATVWDRSRLEVTMATSNGQRVLLARVRWCIKCGTIYGEPVVPTLEEAQPLAQDDETSQR